MEKRCIIYEIHYYYYRRSNFQSPRKKYVFIYNLSSAGCLYLCIYVDMYVFAVVATPFDLQLRNFGTTFLVWLSKNVFSNFMYFCKRLIHFIVKFGIKLQWRVKIANFNVKEIYKKGNNSAKKQFFKNLRKSFLDSHMRNVVPKFRSCRLNGVATIAIT